VSYTEDQLKTHLDWVSENVDGKPFGIDVVMPAKYVGRGEMPSAEDFEAMIPDEHRAYVERLLQSFDVPKLPEGMDPYHGLLAWSVERAAPQIHLALSYGVKMVVNALGPPPPDIVEACHAKGSLIGALTGSVRHARRHVENGVDVVIAVGTEAGGHCGEVSTMVLAPEVVDAVAPTHVLVGGGIGCGRQIAAVLAMGAQGAWMGSRWLVSEEAAENPIVQQKLIAATSRDTVRSKSISGKPARVLKTAWTEAWDGTDTPDPLPLPLHFMLTAEATSRLNYYAALGNAGAAELLTSPVGQIVGRMNAVEPVQAIFEELVEELRDSLARLKSLAD
jgi:NAD(P)H-dependent flavin oxidoreductase YrpB (nitropropane dioxygenase family)